MFRSKRHVGGEVLDGGYRTETDSLLKKQRISNLIFSSVTATTTGSEKSAGEGDSSGLVGDGKSGSSTDGPSLPDMASGDKKPQDIDEDLHSRQLAVYGRETMRWIFASNVLISGMQGLGAEIAKNLILTGVKSVTLHDEGMVELWDLSSNFIFSEDDIGKNRAIASVQKLQELNKAVVVSIVTTKLTKEQLADFQAVVFTDINLETAIAFDDFCHNHKPPIAFIKAEVRGLFGNVFCDFGPTFTILDVDGEEPHTGIISSIRNENFANVSCIPDKILGFKIGDLVVFSEIRGMTELNDGKPRKIDSVGYYSFTLDEDTTTFGRYEKGGIVTQVKQPRVLKFKPLREALKDPDEFLLSDSSKFYRASLVRLAFQALDKFLSEFGRLPLSGSEEEAKKLISIAVNINESSRDNKLEEIDIDPIILRHFAFGARAVLNPMAAMFGGIVAQEVIKACSRKFTPLFQFFFESVESLPTEQLEPSNFFPLNSRYDAQISVFGSKLQKKLEEAQVFVVGAGALGCEFLKNLALMGVSCNNQGKLTVTDDDIIKKNYLSSQFLFRDWNIGQAKSNVAASAASLINPSLQIEASQERVGHETENVFNDSFWEKQSVIVNALDNDEARLYVDNRCLYFQKPFLDSGSVGAKCYTQMVIPHLTENYGTTRKPPDKPAEERPAEVESCPYKIDHCLTWARSEFKTLLEETPAEVNAYLSNPHKYESAITMHILERVLECLDKYICKTFQDCICWARLKFEDYFSYRVKELILTHPEDVRTLSGYPFWSAPKRFPQPLQFSATDRSHLQFIMYASILRAETFGIPIPDWAKDPNKYAEAVDQVTVPEFQPKQNAKILTDDDKVQIFEELIKKLEQCRSTLPSNFRMKPVLFEKDDDTNHHMDLIAALTNMRARNYSIPEVDKLKAKIIAGEILPAIATSAATAAGLVCLELYKVLDGGHKVEDYRNTLVNLALPFFSTPRPRKPKVHKYRDMSWTVWDRWTLEDNPTIGELVQWLKAKGFYTFTVSAGGVLLFNSILPAHNDRIDKLVVDLLREVAEVEPPPNRRHFDVVVECVNNELEEVDIPEVSVYFR